MKMLKLLLILMILIACNLGTAPVQNNTATSAPDSTAQSPTALPTLTPLDYKTPTPPPILEGDKNGAISFNVELSDGKIFTLRKGAYRWSLDGRLFGGIAAGGNTSPIAY
ncbi:MAG: hypothetical protein ACPG7F_18200, partial [Aggregatilineales bacterium]